MAVKHEHVAGLVVDGQPFLLDRRKGHALLLAAQEHVALGVLLLDVLPQALSVRSARDGEAADRLLDLHHRHPDRAEVIVRSDEEPILMRWCDVQVVVRDRVANVGASEDEDVLAEHPAKQVSQLLGLAQLEIRRNGIQLVVVDGLDAHPGRARAGRPAFHDALIRQNADEVVTDARDEPLVQHVAEVQIPILLVPALQPGVVVEHVVRRREPCKCHRSLLAEYPKLPSPSGSRGNLSRRW